MATFYTMYKRKPTGEYLVSVCTNTLCALLGGDEIYAALSEHLGVGMNETTDDGKITLEHAECLAACDYAPVVTVNYEFFDQQTIDSAATWSTRCGRACGPSRHAVLRCARSSRSSARSPGSSTSGPKRSRPRPPARRPKPVFGWQCAAVSRRRATVRPRTVESLTCR